MKYQEQLNQAIQLLQSGERAQAQKLLTQVLSAEPNNEQAWWWMANCLQDAQKQRFCLQKVLALNPGNLQAQRLLQELEGRAPQSPGAPAGAEPVANTQPARPAAQSPEVGAVAPASPQPATGNVPLARKKSPARKKSSGMSAFQVGCLLFLFAFLLAALGGLGYVLLQAGVISLPGVLPAASQVVQANPPATLGVVQLPPTWTPLPSATPTMPPSPTPLTPTATSSATPTPLPSITPRANQWRIVIGHSVANRPIEIFRYGSGEREIMVVAGIHGGEEWNTIALADEMIAYLDKNPAFVPENVSLYILRSLNPDGEKRGKSPDGRANENGVDLNRNFDANWKEEWKRDGCWSERPVTSGESAESEPETKALVNFLRQRRVQVLVSYHSAGLGIFPAGAPPDERSVDLAKEIAKITGYQYPPVSTTCEFTGTLVDWAMKQQIVAVDVELVDSERTDFDLNLEVLKMLFTWQP